MSTVEVCGICDIAGCWHIRERAAGHVQLPPRGLRLPAQRGYCDTCRIEDVARQAYLLARRGGKAALLQEVMRAAAGVAAARHSVDKALEFPYPTSS